MGVIKNRKLFNHIEKLNVSLGNIFLYFEESNYYNDYFSYYKKN